MSPPLNRTALLGFLRSHRYVVQSSTHPSEAPQSAVVGIAVSESFEIVFDTLATSRRAQNLRHNSLIAFVIGGLVSNDERTVQYEGIADELSGSDRTRLRDLYYTVFPDGQERLKWSGLIYIRTVPTWLRYSNYNQDPPEIHEFDRAALQALK